MEFTNAQPPVSAVSGGLNVLVIGGGLGGLCLAQGLKKGGVSVKVFERESQPPSRTGENYSLQINAFGNQALHACLPADLWKIYLATTGRPVTSMCFTTAHLRRLMAVEWGQPADETQADWRVSRRKLRQVLLAGLEEVVQFGRAFVRYEITPEKRVRAFFEDGSSAVGDVLVGADGVSSRVRTQFLPEANVRDLHVSAVGAKYRLTEETAKRLADPLTRHMTIVLPPRGCGMFVTQFVGRKRCADPATEYAELRAPDLEDHVFWALIAKREKFGAGHDLRHTSATELQDLVLGMIHDWDPTLRRLVMESDPPSFIAISLQSADAVPGWETTNVTLLGDAVHTMTPLQGLGGNTALRDAQSLCRVLLEASCGQADLFSGLRTYEAAMRVYASEAVRVSLRYTQSFVSGSRLERAAFEGVLVVADAIPPLKRRMFRP